MVNYEKRQELNALSKEVFGTSSRWQKLVNSGYAELVTREIEEAVPAANEGEEPTKQTVRKPVLTANGATQSVIKHHTVESVEAYMLQRKEELAAYKAAILKMQADQKAAQEQAELAKKIHAEAAGSAGL